MTRTTPREARAARAADLLGRFLEIVDTDVLSREADKPVSTPSARVDLEVLRVTAGTPDGERLVPASRHRDVRGFFARGDVGWIAHVQYRFVGWIWLSRVSHRDPWSGLRIRLAPGEAYAYALWVEPDFRPAGVPSALMSSMLREVHEDGGLERVYGWVDSRNRPSQALMRMSGFRPVQRVKRLHVLRRFGTQVPGSDKPSFGPLSRTGIHAEAKEQESAALLLKQCRMAVRRMRTALTAREGT